MALNQKKLQQKKAKKAAKDKSRKTAQKQNSLMAAVNRKLVMQRAFNDPLYGRFAFLTGRSSGTRNNADRDREQPLIDALPVAGRRVSAMTGNFHLFRAARSYMMTI